MAAQEHKKRPASARETTSEDVAPAAERVSVTDGVDDLLDEIDEVLEQNAEDFVKSYVQKGGE